jgi:hypothetical protein
MLTLPLSLGAGGISKPKYKNLQFVAGSSIPTSGTGVAVTSNVGIGIAAAPQANRVCILGYYYIEDFNSTPPSATYINGIAASNMVWTVGAGNVLIQIVACLVGATDDSTANGGYDIEIVDTSNLLYSQSVQYAVWDVIMPNITEHNATFAANGSGFSTDVLPSMTIPSNGFSVLIGYSGAGLGIASVDTGFVVETARSVNYAAHATTTSSFSGNITVTWNNSSGAGLAAVASWAGDGS